jgi:hypothetical protein
MLSKIKSFLLSKLAPDYAQLVEFSKQDPEYLNWVKTSKYEREHLLSWYGDYKRARKAEGMLETLKNLKDLNYISHIHDLEEKNKKLKQEVRTMQVKAEEVNKTLYATGLIVNCTGCIAGHPDHYEDLTEEKVREVELIASRLRTWWGNYQWRISRKEGK